MVMTVDEAARYLRISETKLRDLIRTGAVPALNDGVILLSRAALETLMGGGERFFSQAELDRTVEEARVAERAAIIAKLLAALESAQLDRITDRMRRNAA